MWHMLNFHFWCDKRIKKSIKHQHPGEPLTTYCELLYAQKNSILYQVNSTIFDLFICPDLLYMSFVLFVANQMYEWRMFKPWKWVRGACDLIHIYACITHEKTRLYSNAWSTTSEVWQIPSSWFVLSGCFRVGIKGILWYQRFSWKTSFTFSFSMLVAMAYFLVCKVDFKLTNQIKIVVQSHFWFLIRRREFIARNCFTDHCLQMWMGFT